MSEPLTVTARPWEHGWELIISEDDATQVRSLDNAVDQVRDYLGTLDPETDHSATPVLVVPEVAA
ncbi:hypothetical protein [Brevibacterium litoralis]|uniref:hypothetical protein n=1 Tax=Brevibacterium litoralis TaxID=3138935 RepID=UPI0032EB2479